MSGTNNAFIQQQPALAAVPAVPQQISAHTPEVSARETTSLIARTYEPIAEVMDRTTRDFTRYAAEEARSRAANEAASTRFQRDEEGRLVPPDVSGSFTVRQETRRQILGERYGLELANDQQDRIAQLRQRANQDPEQFRRLYNEHVTALIPTIPESLRGPASVALDRLGTQHFNNMMAQRVERERREAGEQLLIAVQRAEQDASDARRGGADGSADRARALQLLDDHPHLLDGETRVRLRRQIETVSPIVDGLIRDTRRNPAGQGQVVQALLGGPGTPGWREEWNGLLDSERQGLARMVQGMQSAARQDIQFGQSQRDYNERTVAARLNLDLARTRHDIAMLPPGADRSALEQREASTLAQIVERAPRYAAEAITRQTAQEVARRGADNALAVGRVALSEAADHAAGMGLNLGEGGDNFRRMDPRIERILALPASVGPGVMAERLQRVISDQAAEMALAQRTAAPQARWNEALASAAGAQLPLGMGRQVDNSAENQQLAARTVADLHGPGLGVNQVPASTLRAVAAAGVVFPQTAQMMNDALARGDLGLFVQMSERHQAMMDDNRAQGRYVSAVPEALRNAYSGTWENLQAARRVAGPGLDAAAAEAATALGQRAVMELAQRIARHDPGIEQELRPRLGETRDDQNDAIRRAQNAALAERGLTAISVPAVVQRSLDASFWRQLPMQPDNPQQAASRALSEVMTNGGWAISQWGFDNRGTLPTPGTPGLSGDGSVVAASPPPRLMQNAPEALMVPEGRMAGLTNRWVEGAVHEALRENRVPARQIEAALLGSTMFLRPSSTVNRAGQPLYEVWTTVTNHGATVLAPVPRVVADRRTVEVLTVDLHAGRQQRIERWTARYGPEWEATRRAFQPGGVFNPGNPMGDQQ